MCVEMYKWVGGRHKVIDLELYVQLSPSPQLLSRDKFCISMKHLLHEAIDHISTSVKQNLCYTCTLLPVGATATLPGQFPSASHQPWRQEEAGG